MAVPGSAPIGISDIVAEFGGPGGLTDYVRGGPYVPNIPANNGVPTAAPLDVLDFLGATAGYEWNSSLAIGSGGGAYGYDAAGFFGPFGSLSPNSYTDDSSASRTVVGITYDTGGAGTLGFTLGGSGVPNNNSTFETLHLPGGDFNRSAATYDSDIGGMGLYTGWSWSTGTNPIGTSGTVGVGLTI